MCATSPERQRRAAARRWRSGLVIYFHVDNRTPARKKVAGTLRVPQPQHTGCADYFANITCRDYEIYPQCNRNEAFHLLSGSFGPIFFTIQATRDRGISENQSRSLAPPQ